MTFGDRSPVRSWERSIRATSALVRDGQAQKAVDDLEKAQRATEESRKALEKPGAINVSLTITPASLALTGPVASLTIERYNEVMRGASR
jgi:hypothetical protein